MSFEFKELSKLAERHWNAKKAVTYNEELVEKLYESHLKPSLALVRDASSPTIGKSLPRSAQMNAVQALDMLGYSEKYLIPFLTRTSSFEHIMSIVIVSMKCALSS